jgi:glycosyltransferase involved in cell wall biosynthesis
LKVLAITTRHPPYHIGGHEIRCGEILDALAERGHEVLALTTVKDTRPKPTSQAARYPVLRMLHFRKQVAGFMSSSVLKRLPLFFHELQIDLQDTAWIEQQIKTFQPDILYLGHIDALSRALMPYLSTRGIPLLFDEGGDGLHYLRKNKGLWYFFVDEYSSRRQFVNSLKPFMIEIIYRLSGGRLKKQWAWPANMQIVFTGETSLHFAISMGVPLVNARVIHSGINLNIFNFTLRTSLGYPIQILAPGRIEPPKGQIDAVRLLAALASRGVAGRLVVVGEERSKSYYIDLTREIARLNLEEKVEIMPMVAQDRLVELYQRSDICLFSSSLPRGLSRTLLEAMACGCLVFSYGFEGSTEVIQDRKTGFLFTPGDFPAMADTIEELRRNPLRVRELTWNARREIEEKWSFVQYVDKIEQILVDTVERT